MDRTFGISLLVSLVFVSNCTDDLAPGDSLSNYGMNSSVKNKYLFYKDNGGSNDYYFQLELDSKPDFGGRDTSAKKVRYDYDLRVRGDRIGAPIDEALVKFEFQSYLDDFVDDTFVINNVDEDLDYQIESSGNEVEIVYMRYLDSAGLWSSADEILILIDTQFEFRVDGAIWGEFRDAAEYSFTVP